MSDLDTIGKHRDELVTGIARDALKALAANTRTSIFADEKISKLGGIDGDLCPIQQARAILVSTSSHSLDQMGA